MGDVQIGPRDNPHRGEVSEIEAALAHVAQIQDRANHVAHHSRSPIACRAARRAIDAALTAARKELWAGLAEAKEKADAVDLAWIKERADA